MPLQTFAVFWRNTEKSEAAMSLLWSAEVSVILDSDGKIGLLCIKFNSKCSFTRFFYGLKWLKAILLL